MKDEKLYFLHIVQAARWIDEDTQKNREVFFANRTVRDAVIKNLANLAESASQISDTTKKKLPHIPWNKIRGMRNILVHDYLGDVDYDAVWKTIERDIPILVSAIESLIKK
jgi:uncharacterized protein with HEPN domain